VTNERFTVAAGVASMLHIRRVFWYVFILILTVFLSLSGHPASAQTYIFGRADFAVGGAPIAIAKGDFNNDGILDLVVANSYDDTVSVLLGKSNGTFAPQTTYGTGPEPVSVAVGDFNGDGNLDIAVTNGNCTFGFVLQCNPSTVSILLGNGDGTFQPHVDYAVAGLFPSSVVTSDFNGDGKLDLAIAAGGIVSVLLGNGDGTFQTHVDYSTAGPSSWQSVVVGDFNGDHILDLAVSCGSVVSVLLGNGDGTFRTHVDSGAGGSSLAAGDFNHDGKLDLVVIGSSQSRSLNVLLGNGDGTFTLNAIYPGGDWVAVSDLNGDGKPDLVVAEEVLSGGRIGSVSILLGNGDGTFQSGVPYGTGNSPAGVVVADFNGDGKEDLAVTAGCDSLGPSACGVGNGTPTSGVVSVLLGFGDGTFVGKSSAYGVGKWPYFITSADFNNDGKLDLATANNGDNTASVLLGKGDGTFQPQRSFQAGASPVSVAAGDFRNNGNVDLAVANENCLGPPCTPGSVSVLLGNGDGTFQPHVDYPTGLEPVNLAVADLRGNGKLDLAVSNMGAGTVSILLGNGDGTFQSQVPYVTASSPQQAVVGDFNQDGKLDLAILAGQAVSILLGNGDGTFKTHVDYPGGGYSIAVSDFNGDGRLDLAIANGGLNAVSILLGNGDGTFQLPVVYPAGVEALSIAAADFNQDGKPDLATSGAGPFATILLGNGDGTFRRPIQYVAADDFAQSFNVNDFNGDGSPDWAAADVDTNAIYVMLSAAFKAVSPTALSFGSQGVGTTSLPQPVTISNPSNVKFGISSIGASGNFRQTNDCPANLTVGANCTIKVIFSPAVTGLNSGAITLVDGTRNSPEVIALTGTGVSGPFLTLTPNRFGFETLAIGTMSAPAIITLANTGNAPLSIAGISIAGTNSSDFAQTNSCGSSLPVGGQCGVSVTFKPTGGGVRTATLAISDNASGSPQLANLVGMGTGPGVNLGPNSLTFSSQAVGTTSAAQVVTLSNPGSGPLNITQISASGDFAESNTCNASLAAGSACPVSVTFTPTSAGSRTGQLTFADNAPGSPQTVALSGTGTSLALTATSNTATVAAGVTATYALSIGGGGVSGPATLTCTGAPKGAMCSVSPATVNVSATTTSPLTVAVTTTSRTMAARIRINMRPSSWLWAVALIGLAVLPTTRTASMKSRARRYVQSLSLLVLLLLAACGGGGGSSNNPQPNPNGTPVGTYTLTVTATSGVVQQSMPLTLTVQ